MCSCSGTPSAGLTKATWFARFKRQWRDLRPESPFIRSLRAEWDQKFGAKPPFELVSIAGDRDEFVPAASCFAPFPANCCAVVPGNHLEMVKPASTAELSVQIVLKRLSAGSTLPVCPPADAANVTSPLMLMPSAFEQRRSRRFGLRIFAAIVAAVAIIAAGALYFGGNHINSLAVLPFTNATGDANMEYLSDGITEGITDRLSELPSLKVISRTSAFHYKQREIAPQRVAKELGVQALVTGRVVQHGTDLSVSAELVDAREDKQLWGEQYSWTMANMTSVQREIAIAISRNLRVHLTSGEKKELAKSYTTNTEAYQLYLKGRYYWGKNTVEALHKGIEYFQQAIEKDPGNAQAYAGLAGCYDDLAGGMAYLPPQENFPKAKAAAMKALELDDTLAEAHTALGWIKWGYDWDWSSAQREYKRAIELDASSAVAHGRYGTYLVTMGRFDEGIAEGRRAQELDPLSQRIVGFLGYQYLVAGRYDESISQLKKAIELDPAATWLHAMLGWAYARKGMYAQAIAEHERMGPQAYAVSGENQTVAAGLAWIYALAGRQKDATRILDAFNHLPSQTYVDFYQVGVIYAGLGDKERAFESLQKGYAQRSGGMAYLKVEPFWDNVRSDPRFADLLRRIGLPQ